MALVQIVPLQAPRTPGERCKVGFISHDNQNIYVLGVGFGGQALPARCVTLPSTIVRNKRRSADSTVGRGNLDPESSSRFSIA